MQEYTLYTDKIECMRSEVHSHIIGQVVFIEGVGFKAVWCSIKIVTSNATNKAFCLPKRNITCNFLCKGIKGILYI